MDVREITNMVMNRVRAEGWTLDPYRDLAKVLEEAGELSREIRRYEDGRERPDEVDGDKEEIRKEIACEIGDIIFPIVKILSNYNLTLEDAVMAHEKKMNARQQKQI